MKNTIDIVNDRQTKVLIEERDNILEEPFIKKFKTENNNYIYDVNTNEILKVDEVTYDIINDYRILSKAEIVKKYKSKHKINQINKIYELIDTTNHENGYFSNSQLKGLRFEFSIEELSKMLRYNLRQLILNITEECNFRCRYCVYSGHYNYRRNHSSKSMSFEVAKKAIDYFITNSSKSETRIINFYGGEPLIRFELIKRIIEYIKIQLKVSNVRYSLTTNGTILNDKIIKFLIEHNVGLLISLDGPADVHNNYRILANGKPTFELIIKNIKRIMELDGKYYKKKVSFNSTLTPPYDISKIINFFQNSELLNKNNARLSDLDPIDTTFFDNLNRSDLIPLMKLKEKWLNDNATNLLLNNKLDSVPQIKSYLYGLISPLYKRAMNCVPEFIPPSGQCIIGQRKIFVNTIGDYFMCEKVDHAYCIGDLNKGLNIDNIYTLLNELCKLSEKYCCNCWATRLCSICIRSKLTGKKLDTRFSKDVCTGVRKYQEKALILFCSIMEKGAKQLATFFNNNIDTD